MMTSIRLQSIARRDLETSDIVSGIHDAHDRRELLDYLRALKAHNLCSPGGACGEDCPMLVLASFGEDYVDLVADLRTELQAAKEEIAVLRRALDRSDR